MRKPDLCENKDADQLCNYCTVDQHLCFCHMDSTTPLLLTFEISVLACFGTGLFVADLVRNPDCWFSLNMVQSSVGLSRRNVHYTVIELCHRYPKTPIEFIQRGFSALDLT